MTLKAHCDMRKQEQRNYIIARELDIPMWAECLIPWQLYNFFVPVSSCHNELSTSLNHCLIIVATAKQG